MSQPVWKARTKKEPDALLISLCAGRDTAEVPAADAALLPHDIRLNMAHALMLCKQRIISTEAAQKLLRGLRTLAKRAASGTFALDPKAEDVHINVEHALESLAGVDAAGRLHSARSRNDQVSTDMRLWLREALLDTAEEILDFAAVLTKRAKRDAEAVCPGFTHMQPAQVTTLGHLWAHHAVALSRDAEALLSLRSLINLCPLGAAASFGTAWPIDRKQTASLLGFDGPTLNTLDSIANRWEGETRVAQAIAIALTHLSALAQDIIWISTPPRDWVRLDDAHVTGSSIMPQKRNPDLAEVTRARAVSAQATAQAIVATATGQLSGYNRDLQWTKYHVMDVRAQIAQIPTVWGRVISGLTVDRKAMRKACEVGFMEAAEVADFLSQRSGAPFRTMHHVLARAVAMCDDRGQLTRDALNDALAETKVKYTLSEKDWSELSDPVKRLSLRSHVGSPEPASLKKDLVAINDGIKALAKQAKQWRRDLFKAESRLQSACERILTR